MEYPTPSAGYYFLHLACPGSSSGDFVVRILCIFWCMLSDGNYQGKFSRKKIAVRASASRENYFTVAAANSWTVSDPFGLWQITIQGGIGFGAKRTLAEARATLCDQ
jgi:hypothetical protein